MAFVRGWLLALVAAPASLLIAGPALAADPASGSGLELPRGIYRGQNGRYYEDVCDHSFRFHCLSKRLLPETYRPLAGGGGNAGGYCDCGSMGGCGGGGSSPPSGSMAPANVLGAYKVPPSSAAGGKIVAIVDMPDASALEDLNVYRKAFGIAPLPQCPGSGLPDPTTGTPCFAAVDESGKVTSSAGDCASNDGETGLDEEMISAACPDCSILLVQLTDASMTNGPTDLDFVAAAKAAIRDGAVAVSLSFGGQEFSDPTGQDYTTPGHLVVAASGDAGYLNQGLGGSTPSYPSSAPDVLAIGGTTLQLTGKAYSEVTWNDGSQGGAGGSGCSTEFAMPAYQTQFLSTHAGAFGSCTKRASVDVSAAAEFGAGNFGGAIAEYDTGDGWVAVVGTSAAAPLVAGLFTRLDLTDVVSANLGWVYDNLAAFNDVTSGSNDLGGSCTNILCKAGPGWDGPTGVGTPNGEALALRVVPPPSDAGSSGGDGGSGDCALPGGKSGCGCATGARGGLETGMLAVGGVVAAFALRRRRRAS